MRRRPYRILFANGSVSLQGDTKVSLTTLKALEALAQIRVLTVEGEAAAAFQSGLPTAEIRRLPDPATGGSKVRQGLGATRLFAALIQHIRQFRPDVLYTYDRTMAASMVCFAGIITRHPFIYHVTNAEMFAYQRVRYKMVEHASAIWSMSDFIRRSALANRVYGKHDVILGCYADSPLAITKQAARQQLGIPEQHVAVALVGRLSPFKGQDTLLQAMADPRIVGTNIHAYIAGSDNGDGRFLSPPILEYAEYLRRRAVELGVHDRVTFLGQQPGQLVFRAADIAAIPSDAEPFGLVIPEAMSSGVPIIATDTGAFPELLRHGEDGLLVPARDPQRLAESLRFLHDHPQQAEALAQNAKTCALPRLAFPRYRDEVQQKFLRIMERRPPRAR